MPFLTQGNKNELKDVVFEVVYDPHERSDIRSGSLHRKRLECVKCGNDILAEHLFRISEFDIYGTPSACLSHVDCSNPKAPPIINGKKIPIGRRDNDGLAPVMSANASLDRTTTQGRELPDGY